MEFEPTNPRWKDIGFKIFFIDYVLCRKADDKVRVLSE